MANTALQNLTNLVNDLQVRVAGFASFGDPLFGSINYWGGFEDLALSLQTHTGVPVILPRIGPLSTNWERACELYCQLVNIQSTGTGYDTRATSPATPIRVDYGQHIALPTMTPHHTKQAVVLGALPANWRWSANHPVHMICHSQGGNTVRLLIELLSGNYASLNPTYFNGNRQNFIRSVVTLGTFYCGTTITDVIFNDILRNVQVGELIPKLVVSASLNPGRFVDLQLDHWGFRPLPGPIQETFLQMYNRLRFDIRNWWMGNNNAVQDNGRAGVSRLNERFSPGVSAATYYFTMSFDATRPLPQRYVSGKDLQSFPVHPVVSGGGWLFPGPFNISANFAATAINITRGIPGTPSDVDYARWAVGLFNDHLRILGYQVRVPEPGGRIPRSDMLPTLSIFSVGMSGMSRSLNLPEENDGVVDTSSMRAPENAPVQNINIFNSNSIPANRGVYWDLGLTEGVDHADQIGVFTGANTYTNVVLPIYERLGDLLSAL
ncbi:hypothetical protein C7999DRAFT_41106 [Corynascus novoguineensis]|uniref:Lipase-like C-terminal domain-containing protein n=1 Tax=Corynascus novoguineensis TaxID=1126955 RepID=A0AAN7HFC7_9PEZI|nr:hypothetical protein C7999DRAFT_41106 [Corynascus novoguineensis]